MMTKLLSAIINGYSSGCWQNAAHLDTSPVGRERDGLGAAMRGARPSAKRIDGGRIRRTRKSVRPHLQAASRNFRLTSIVSFLVALDDF
jgi:hypothetical protein